MLTVALPTFSTKAIILPLYSGEASASPIYRDTNRYPLPFRLTVNAPGIGRREVTSDAPFTVAAKSADRLVLRVATEKDTALFFKFRK